MAPYPWNNQTCIFGRTLTLFFCFVASQDSSVSAVKKKLRAGLRSSIPGRGKDLSLFFPRVQTGCGTSPALFSVDNEGQSLRIKRPEHEAYDSSPSYD